MNKNLLRLFSVLCLALLVSCQSLGKKQPDEEFIVQWDSPQFQIGEVELQTEPPLGLGQLKKMAVPVFYFPDEDAVVLRFRPEFTTFQQCWSNKGRQSFIEALQKYNEDYSARTLDIKNNKSKRKYNVVKGYLIWQQFAFTTRARGNVKIEIGYIFKDNVPYFSINQLEAEYIDEISRGGNRSSSIISLYLTRAQAAELAALFDKDFLNGLKTQRGADSLNNNSGKEYY